MITLTITAKDTLKIIEAIANTIEENKAYLTRLDSAIGDGDHGINLSKGFGAVVQKLPSLESEDIGSILKNVGLTLIDSVGGAVGPLYGTAFIRAGTVAEGKREIDLTDLVEIFEAARQGIMAIGNVKMGEKTMFDAIHPAVEALKEESNKKSTLVEAIEQSVKAAERGMESTKLMVAKRGRSMYLGERTQGHQDVGATSSYLILKSFLDTLKEIRR